ncbi:glycosyltransferase [Limibaculum sp. FT325]|nr:glycosyltransferase [Limibaculum sediminis]
MHPSAGGPPVVVRRLAENASRFGWDASILTTSLMCPDDGTELYAELSREFDIKVLPIDRPRLLGHASTAAEALNDAVRAADLVHIHTLWHPLNTIARRACQRHNVPYVLSPHGMLDPFAMSIRALKKSVYLRLIECRNLREAELVVFATNEERQLAGRTLGRFLHSEVVLLGADDPADRCSTITDATVRRRFRDGADGRRILFLSRLHPKKNLETLFRSMKLVVERHADAHLFIAGSGARIYEKTLDDMVRELGISSNVTFTGFLRDEEKWAAMSAADIFVLPSLQENFGISIAEALHAGLPVLVGQGVNISEDIAKASAGRVLCDCMSEVELARQIVELFEDRDLRERMGRNATRLATERFNWLESARCHYELYERALALDPCERSPI